MKGEINQRVGIVVYQEIFLMDHGRLVLADPMEERWPSLDLANHNVFRLDAAGNVVWQVRREESGYVNWESRHAHAKAEDPNAEGYFDPFWSMGLDESHAQSPEPRGVYRPGCAVYLTTRWWVYLLDVEPGIASCTGEQIK